MPISVEKSSERGSTQGSRRNKWLAAQVCLWTRSGGSNRDAWQTLGYSQSRLLR